MKPKRWLCSFLLAAVSVVPVAARTNDAAETKNGPPANTAPNDKSANTPDSTTTVNTNNADPSAAPTQSLGSMNIAALLHVLETKGIIAPAEAAAIRNAKPEAEFQLLVEALTRKGVLNAADLRVAANPSSAPSAPSDTEAAAALSEAVSMEPQSQTTTQPAPGPEAPPKPAAPSVVAAIAPIRALPIDPPKRDSLVSAFKTGAGVKMTPYGFIKATAVHDSSSPNGDDFPFVGLFLGSTSILSTGPTEDPEFHIKARSTRIGSNFEWLDPSPKLTFTGRVEGDFEGNFSEVDNRDVTSIRSNSFQLRLAYVRMDYAATDKTDIYFEGGQDWALFSSSVLPNILETTFLGAFYGTIYGRTPQMMVGAVHNFGSSRNFKVSPTFAIMMPSSGEIEKLGSLGLQGQIAQAEREGADSGRPEVEGRLAFQFQLDKAPAVAPAQVFWAGFQGRRTSIVPSSSMGEGPSNYAAAFPNGFTTSSTMYGNQAGISLPTRWATLVGSAYFGGDLRFFLGGQVNSYFTDTGGLTAPQIYTTLDGGPLAAAGAAVLATNSAGDVVIAPQKAIRAFGGFANLGLPISRWFNADPKGRMGGWQVYLHVGKDQVVHSDLINPNAGAGANTLSPLPLLMGKMFAGTVYYKLNPWCTFAIEQSVYGTRLEPGVDYTIAGKPSNLWQDHRTEFGPVFSF
jgi:hypothetical protein